MKQTVNVPREWLVGLKKAVKKVYKAKDWSEEDEAITLLLGYLDTIDELLK